MVAVFHISVANGAPVAADDGPLVAGEDQPLVVAGALLLANDSDPDGQPLVVVSADAASNAGGTVAGGAGSFTYTPAGGLEWDGLVRLHGLRRDRHRHATVTLTVRPVNDASVVCGGWGCVGGGG